MSLPKAVRVLLKFFGFHSNPLPVVLIGGNDGISLGL